MIHAQKHIITVQTGMCMHTDMRRCKSQQSDLGLGGNSFKLFCSFKSKLLCKQDAITIVKLN